MKRPVGVTILAVIAIIYGILSLLLALLALLGQALLASGVGAATIKYSAATLLYATISDAVLGILYLTFGIGAFSLKRWAWTTGVVAVVLDVVRQIVGFVVVQGGSTSKIVGAVITVVVALVVLWYLFRPNVRAAFGFGRAA